LKENIFCKSVLSFFILFKNFEKVNQFFFSKIQKFKHYGLIYSSWIAHGTGRGTTLKQPSLAFNSPLKTPFRSLGVKVCHFRIIFRCVIYNIWFLQFGSKLFKICIKRKDVINMISKIETFFTWSNAIKYL